MAEGNRGARQRVDRRRNPFMSADTERLLEATAPLGKREQERAIRVALAEIEGQRYRVLAAELAIDKPARRDEPPARMVRVVVADYDRCRVVDMLVDASGKPARAPELLRYQPAFHPDEIVEARGIAEREPRFAELARTRGLLVMPFAAPVSERPGRLVGLRYLVPAEAGAEPPPLIEVIVDLCAGQVQGYAPSASS
jgi:hypothetical protein